jgi:hypothetical protein
MVKTRVIVATTDPKTGQPLAPGAEVDLDEEAYQTLRSQGAVEASEQEVKEHATPEAQGNYSARTGRSDTGQTEEPKSKEPKEKK